MRLNQLVVGASFALLACQTNPGTQPSGINPAGQPTTINPAGQQTPVDTAAGKPAADKDQLPAGAIGKPQAPVAIEATLAADSAQVTLTFHQAGRNVEVQADGVDGLAVRGEPLLARGRTVAAGEVVTFDVPIAPGPGRSMLAVHVRGKFAAGERAAVRAFPIGKQSAEQLRKANEGKAKIGGEEVHVMQGEEEKKK